MDNAQDGAGAIGGKGSGRKLITDLPRDKHTITVTDELWERLVLVAGGERKVSEEIENVLRGIYKMDPVFKT